MLYIFGNLVTQALLGWWKMSKIVKNFTPTPLKNLKEKWKIFKNLYWSSKTQASLSKLGKLDRSRVLLFAPHLPLKWGAWGANIKCPSIWGAYLIADSNSLGTGANLEPKLCFGDEKKTK